MTDLPPPSPATLVVDARCALAEGPAWIQGRLYWVDIHGESIHQFDPESGEHSIHKTGRTVTVIVPTSDDRFLVCGADGVRVSDMPGTADEGELLSQYPGPEGTRFNDGKCDPTGRLWVGTMATRGQGTVGTLYSFEAGKGLTARVPDVQISNGLAWSQDARTLYYIDTPTKRIDAFDFDPDSGAIKNRRPVFVVPEGMGAPDGMTIDREGFLWVALWGGWCVLRVDPRTGAVAERVTLPVEQVTSCTFGGDDLGTLYITTAGGTNKDKFKTEPHAGGIFQYHPAVGGRPINAFRIGQAGD